MNNKITANDLETEPRQGIVFLGVPGGFGMTYRTIDAEHVGIRVCVAARAKGATKTTNRSIWGAPSRGGQRGDLRLSAAKLLDGLAAAWPVIARPFQRGRPPYQNGVREVADLSTLVGVEGLPTLMFIADGNGLAIEHESGRFESGAECLIVVESLLALGDLLAEKLKGTDSEGLWARTRGLADVFPWRPDSFSESVPIDVSVKAEFAFYAEKFALTGEQLRQWGLRHVANWYLDDKFSALPDAIDKIHSLDEVTSLLDKLGARLGRTMAETIEGAEFEFLVECRNHFYYKLFPKKL